MDSLCINKECEINNECENNNKTICLNMIVKNESHIIKRLLKSVLPIIDTYCICDTGSTDNTKEIITKFFEKRNIKGKLIDYQFINFSDARNHSLYECENLSDYILLMDADMVLVINNFDKQTILNKDIDTIMLLQGDDNFHSPNIRIIKNYKSDLQSYYEYKEYTHEYLDIKTHLHENVNLSKSELFIWDIGDGGSKSDKFSRDIELLKKSISEDPFNVRSYFYLANSYYWSNDYKNAIKYYKKRIELKHGYYQEIWYSYHKIGCCYMELKRHDKAIYNFLKAYQIYPHRIENLYEIIKYYRNMPEHHNLCMLFYKIAIDVINNKQYLYNNDILFHENDVYTFKLFYEYTIFSAYCNNKNITNELICIFNNCKNDDGLILNTLSNYKFYDNVITNYKILSFDNNIHKMLNNKDTDFISSSSCLIPIPNNKYIMNIRYVNYRVYKDGDYFPKDCFATVNHYIELDNKFEKVSESFEMNDSDYSEVYDQTYNCENLVHYTYIGIEDVRIFYINDKIVFHGTEFDDKRNRLGITFGDYNIKTKKLENKKNLQTSFTTNEDCEKNWVIFQPPLNETLPETENNFKFIYKWSPLTICDLVDDTIHIFKENSNVPYFFKFVRGSTNGVYFKPDNEIWFICHIVSYGYPRYYYDIFIVLDATTLSLKKYSYPFSFHNEAIQFCLSVNIINDENKNEFDIICNVSCWDSTTMLFFYKKTYIDTIMINY